MIKMLKIMNAEVAEILGAFTGDGWIESDEDGMYICGHSVDDKEYYDKHLGPLFSKWFTSVKPKHFQYWHVYGIATYKRDVIRKALPLGFQKGKKCYTVSIPEWIAKGNIETQKAFLRGLFDTDGSFWCEKSKAKTSVYWKRTHRYIPMIAISTCSKRLLEGCKQILDNLEIHSKIREKNKAGILCDRNVNNSYQLKIDRRADVARWFELIGTNNPRHMRRHAEWKNTGFLA